MNFASSVVDPGLAVMAFSGVEQQAETNATNATCSSCTTISRDITTSEDNSLIVSGVGAGGSGSYSSHGTGQTEEWNQNPTSALHSGTREVLASAGADTQSHTASASQNRQAMTSASFTSS